MKRPPFDTLRLRLLGAALGTVIMAIVPAASAQTTGANTNAAVNAQRQYDLDIAVCNNANFPAPQRASCIRDAGQRFDRLRGAPAGAEAEQSADGCATVMTPSPGSNTLRGSTTITTTDGRATVVVPDSNPAP